MAMDEIQDVTVRRSDLRRERSEILEGHFRGFSGDRVGTTQLPLRRFHIRAAMVPMVSQQIVIEPAVLAAANPDDPVLTRGNKNERLDVAFRSLSANWRPVLRGRRIEHLSEGGWRKDDFQYSAKELKADGTFTAEFCCFTCFGDQGREVEGFYFEWIVGFAANYLRSMQRLVDLFPTLSNSVVRIGLNSVGVTCLTGDRMWERRWDWPDGEIYLPDFEVPGSGEMDDALVQVQTDCASIAGQEFPSPFRFVVS